jgi:hypothetical protein
VREQNVKAFLDAHLEFTDTESADKVRYALLRRIESECSVAIGPSAKTAVRIREEILRGPTVWAGTRALVAPAPVSTVFTRSSSPCAARPWSSSGLSLSRFRAAAQ